MCSAVQIQFYLLIVLVNICLQDLHITNKVSMKIVKKVFCLECTLISLIHVGVSWITGFLSSRYLTKYLNYFCFHQQPLGKDLSFLYELLLFLVFLSSALCWLGSAINSIASIFLYIVSWRNSDIGIF